MIIWYQVDVSKDLVGCMSCSKIWSLSSPNSLLLDSFLHNINVHRIKFDQQRTLNNPTELGHDTYRVHKYNKL